MRRIFTTDEFISKARTVHGDKYDYSKSEYISTQTKICIICPIHGEFWQTPKTHLNGGGCKECGKESGRKKQSLNTESFIERSRQVHGFKYDYSLVNYKNNNTKIKIICPKHGVFEQLPSNHLKGRGCRKCRNEYYSDIKSMKRDDFLVKANSIHDNKYRYNVEEKVRYKDYTEIECSKHGLFLQRVSCHLHGCGCPKCAEERNLTNLRKDTKDFIISARKVHGNRYGYDKVRYIKSSLPVIITCFKHGDFTQIANNHLRGNGCPICGESKGECKIEMFLRKTGLFFIRQYKITDIPDAPNIRVDFFVPDNNIVIEFNGIQHYEIVEYFGGIEKFEKQQLRDSSLRMYCEENKIKLIEIPYWDLDNIENILKRELEIL